MFEGVGEIIKDIADERHSLKKRLFLFALIVMPILLADNAIGFSYYYGMSHKIEGVEKIESMIKNDSINPAIKNDLILLEKDLIDRQDLFSRLWSFSSLAISRISSRKAQTDIANKPNIVSKGRLILHLLSSGIFFILGFAMSFVYLIYNIFKQNKPYTEAASLLCIFFGVMTYLVPGFLWKVPILADNYFWNYLLNLAIQVLLLLWFFQKFFFLLNRDNQSS